MALQIIPPPCLSHYVLVIKPVKSISMNNDNVKESSFRQDEELCIFSPRKANLFQKKYLKDLIEFNQKHEHYKEKCSCCNVLLGLL